MLIGVKGKRCETAADPHCKRFFNVRESGDLPVPFNYPKNFRAGVRGFVWVYD